LSLLNTDTLFIGIFLTKISHHDDFVLTR